MISQFKVGRSLGGGAVGEVHLAELKTTKERVAIKVK